MSLTISSRSLSGIVKIPPSKSMAHRLLLCAGLANGKSTISNIELSDDVKATIGALEKMGRIIDVSGDKCEFTGELSYNGQEIDCKESGSTLRFIIPIISALGGGKLNGEKRLGERPLKVYKEIFKNQGLSMNEGFPLKIEGGLKTGEFKVKGNISSQFISGLMLAAPLLMGDVHIALTTKLESKGYVYMTIQAMKEFGIEVKTIIENKEFLIEAKKKYNANNKEVEGDWSQSGFWILAGLNSEKGIEINGLNKNTFQGDKAILKIAEKMGANISLKEKSIKIKKTILNRADIDISQCPDLAPVVAGMMAVSGERCVLSGCERLKIKESDRIKSIVETLNSLGSNAKSENDKIIIKGRPIGGSVKTYNDHRIAMMAASLAPYCEKEVIIDDEKVVNKSYPKFWDDYKNLGGHYV